MGESVSEPIIPKSVDKAMDKEGAGGALKPAGISIRNGPVTEDRMEIDGPAANGKRKSRGSAANARSYKEASDEDEEDVVPKVGNTSPYEGVLLFIARTYLMADGALV
jgi:DNA topoisomerase-1